MSHLKIQLNHTLSNSERSSFCLQVDVGLPNTVTAIFGESGAGKTTLLRAVAGLEKLDKAHVSVGDEVWQSDCAFVPTHKRQLSYVFQKSGLFPHLTVEKNIAYGAKRAKTAVKDKQAIYELLNISALLPRLPDKLSGGEQQRVAIARAMMHQPKLLLLDEPLASLDQARKEEVLPYLEALCAELQIPALYVSHSMDEISRLARHIVVLSDGQVTAQGDLIEVLNKAEMLGSLGNDHAVLLPAVVDSVNNDWGLLTASIAGGLLQLRNEHLAVNSKLRLQLRAKDVSIALSPANDSSILNVLAATVRALHSGPDNASTLVELEIKDEQQEQGTGSVIFALITRRSLSVLNIQRGQQVWAQIKSVAVVR